MKLLLPILQLSREVVITEVLLPIGKILVLDRERCQRNRVTGQCCLITEAEFLAEIF